MNLPALNQGLEEIGFFEREQTDRQVVEVAILLYNCGLSLRRVTQVFGWMGVAWSHVAVWT